MATWAIGDVQGCGDALRRLLVEIRFDPRRDRLWFVGDLVNRGDDSLGVLRRIRDLGDRAVVVLGNHDLHLLAIAAGVRVPARKDTLDGVLDAPDRAELLDWLRTRPLLHRDPERRTLLVHAGVVPGWSLDALASRVDHAQARLRGAAWATHLRTMYGDQPERWSDDLGDDDAARLAINACTRLRIVDARDRLELRFKGPRALVPEGWQPWFARRHRPLDGWQVVFGHWAALSGVTGVGWAHALDTGCVWGETLTAMRLDDRVRVAVPARGA